MNRTATIRMPEQLYTDLKAHAEKEGKSLNALCVELFQSLIDSEQVRTNHKPPAATQTTTPTTPPKPTFTPKGF